MTSLKNKPIATAILAVYNSQQTVIAAISSLLTQSVPIEIIVVDDGSSDQTPQLVKKLGVTLFRLPHEGPALARNYGAKHALADILLFVDADMTFAPDYVSDLIKPIQSGQVIGTYTVDERVANWDNKIARCWNLVEGWEDKKRFPQKPPLYGTDYRAILRSEFERVGGFDNIGYTDTWSLFNKLGIRPLATQATCYHKNPDTWDAVYRQAKWAAKRPYKFGVIGTLAALIRTSLVVSPLSASYGSLIHHNFTYFVFKLVYDYGRFVGILEMILRGKLSK